MTIRLEPVPVHGFQAIVSSLPKVGKVLRTPRKELLAKNRDERVMRQAFALKGSDPRLQVGVVHPFALRAGVDSRTVAEPACAASVGGGGC